LVVLTLNAILLNYKAMDRQESKKHSGWVWLLFLLALGFGFFVPVSKTDWLGYLIKAVVFILVFVYTAFVPLARPLSGRKKSRSSNLESHEPAEASVSQEPPSEGFRETFDRFVEDGLTVIRSMMASSHSALYLKRGGENLEFQAGQSDREREPKQSRIDEGDLADSVYRKGSGVLESNLPIRTRMPGFPESEIRSFLGVPLVLDNRTIGVLALGSRTTETFGQEDMDLLSRYGSLFGRMMGVCYRGLVWQVDREILKIHTELEKRLEGAADEDSAVSVFVDCLRRVFPVDRFTLCTKKGEDGSIRHAVGIEENDDRGIVFPMEAGLCGLILRRGLPVLIPDLEEGNVLRPRYFREETKKHGLRSFLGIPLRKQDETWACLTVECREVAQYAEKDKDVFTILSVPFQFVYEKIRLAGQLRELGGMGGSSQPVQFQIE
jgi:GAF domain-containing protein